MTVAQYIKQLLSYEEYSFSWDELRIKSNKTNIALKRELSRLGEKKEIVNLRKGFYLIIPPKYSKQAYLPVELYVDKLFKTLKKDYYLAFFTAAKFHGASHQQIHKEYIMTSIPPLSNIKKKNINIHFLSTSKWPKKNILTKKSDAGYFNLSSPALTMVDLIHYQTKLGGLNRILPVLDELIDELNEKDLSDLLSWYPYTGTLQRLGYLMETLKADKALYQIILNHLKKSNLYPVLLAPKNRTKNRTSNNKWKVIINIKLENDL